MTREKAYEILDKLPRCTECDGTFPYNCDECDDAFLMAFNALGQPEIIRCKDCRYWQDKWEQDKFSEENHTTMPCIEMATTDDFYCGFAKEKDGEHDG